MMRFQTQWTGTQRRRGQRREATHGGCTATPPATDVGAAKPVEASFRVARFSSRRTERAAEKEDQARARHARRMER